MTREEVETLFAQMLRVPYLPNAQTNPQHERDFQRRLEALGFRSARLKSLAPTKAMWANDTKQQWMGQPFSGDALLEPKTFVEQPYGSQGNPDFLVCPKVGVYWGIELKSSKDPKPMLNSAVHRGYIYLLSTKGEPHSTVFRGEDVLSADDAQMYTEIDTRLKSQKGAQSDVHNRGLYIFNRLRQEFRSGCGHHNFFTHPDRVPCEQRVRASMLNAVDPLAPVALVGLSDVASSESTHQRHRREWGDSLHSLGSNTGTLPSTAFVQGTTLLLRDRSLVHEADDGLTWLAFAVLAANEGVVKDALSMGADPFQRSKTSNENAFDVAKTSRNGALQVLLLSSMDDPEARRTQARAVLRDDDLAYAHLVQPFSTVQRSNGELLELFEDYVLTRDQQPPNSVLRDQQPPTLMGPTLVGPAPANCPKFTAPLQLLLAGSGVVIPTEHSGDVPFKRGVRLTPNEETAEDWLKEYKALVTSKGKDRSGNWRFQCPMAAWGRFIHYLHHRVDGSGPCAPCSSKNALGKKTPCFGAIDKRLDCMMRADDGVRVLTTRMMLGRRVTVHQMVSAFGTQHGGTFGAAWLVNSDGTDKTLLRLTDKLLTLHNVNPHRSVWSFQATRAPAT